MAARVAESARVAELALVAEFQRDGVCVVRGLLTPDQVAVATIAIDDVLATPSWRSVSSPADQPGRFFEDFCRWPSHDGLASIALAANVGAVAAQLTVSSVIRLHHDHVLVKDPGTTMRTPWHQDQPYYNLDGRQTVSFWIPVDPVPIEACLEVIAGSHQGPWLMPRTFIDNESRWFPEGTLAAVPRVDANRDAFDIRSYDMAPGDAVAFNMLSLHGAAGFVGPGRRRVLSLRYIGDDVTHAPRPWPTSPEFPGLHESLLAGAKFDDPCFPIVYPLGDTST